MDYQQLGAIGTAIAGIGVLVKSIYDGKHLEERIRAAEARFGEKMNRNGDLIAAVKDIVTRHDERLEMGNRTHYDFRQEFKDLVVKYERLRDELFELKAKKP